MNIVDALVEQLRTLKSIRFVGVTGDFSKAESEGFVSQALPAVFVIMPSETSETKSSYGHTKRITSGEFTLWIAAMDIQGAVTQTKSQTHKLAALREQVRSLIEGLKLPDCKFITHLRGDPYAGTTKGCAVYQDTYQFEYGKTINVRSQ